jgi:hypothetical protein
MNGSFPIWVDLQTVLHIHIPLEESARAVGIINQKVTIEWTGYKLRKFILDMEKGIGPSVIMMFLLWEAQQMVQMMMCLQGLSLNRNVSLHKLLWTVELLQDFASRGVCLT